MPYKAIVFFDLDGTLLNEVSQLDDEVIEAVHQLQQNNVLPVICTGRSDVEIKEIKAQLGIDNSITLNGQRIVIDGRELYYHIMDHDLVQRFMEFTRAHNHQVAFYSADEIKLTDVDQTVIECYNIINIPLPEVEADFYKHKDVPMMLIFKNPDDVDDDYRNAFPEFEFYRNGPKAMDIVAHGQSKGTGIRILREALNMDSVPTYAFGDGSNDFAMFEAVDYPIAMGNAIEALKEQAVHITTNNTDHGIVNGLKHFNLI